MQSANISYRMPKLVHDGHLSYANVFGRPEALFSFDKVIRIEADLAHGPVDVTVRCGFLGCLSDEHGPVRLPAYPPNIHENRNFASSKSLGELRSALDLQHGP